MSIQPASPGPVPVSTPNAAKKQKPKLKLKAKSKQDSRPTKILPTARLSISKQLDILRAYAAASGKGTKAATTEEASDIVKMSPTTVILANAFLTSIGLLKRADAGRYIPCAEVLEFAGPAYEWDRKTASHKIGPRLRESWFGKALLPRIEFGNLDENVAIGVLGEAAAAGREYEKEIRILIDFMVAGGVVHRDGGQIKLMKSVTPDSAGVAPPRTEDHTETNGQGPTARIDSAYVAHAPGGGVDFRINVHVDMAEFGTWQPQRISAFFRGIAEVLAAKADVEKGGVGS